MTFTGLTLEIRDTDDSGKTNARVSREEISDDNGLQRAKRNVRILFWNFDGADKIPLTDGPVQCNSPNQEEIQAIIS